jgi:hypothetical protein
MRATPASVIISKRIMAISEIGKYGPANMRPRPAITDARIFSILVGCDVSWSGTFWVICLLLAGVDTHKSDPLRIEGQPPPDKIGRL